MRKAYTAPAAEDARNPRRAGVEVGRVSRHISSDA